MLKSVYQNYYFVIDYFIGDCPNRTHTRCKKTTRCIDEMYLCNGVNDCGDETDDTDENRDLCKLFPVIHS